MLTAAHRVITSSAIERSTRIRTPPRRPSTGSSNVAASSARSQSRLITELPVFAPICPTRKSPATPPPLRRWPNSTGAVPPPTSCWWPAPHVGGPLELAAGPEPVWTLPADGAPPAAGRARARAVGRPLPGGARAGAVRRRSARLAGRRLPARRSVREGTGRDTRADVNLVAGGRLWSSSLEPARRAAMAGPPAAAQPRPAWLELDESVIRPRYRLAPAASRRVVVLLMDWTPTQELHRPLQARLLWIGLVAFLLAVGGTTVSAGARRGRCATSWTLRARSPGATGRGGCRCVALPRRWRWRSRSTR